MWSSVNEIETEIAKRKIKNNKNKKNKNKKIKKWSVEVWIWWIGNPPNLAVSEKDRRRTDDGRTTHPSVRTIDLLCSSTK